MDERPQHRARNDFVFPVILILLGVLFLLNEYIPRFGLERTWPVLLIVAGGLLLARSFGPTRPPRGPNL